MKIAAFDIGGTSLKMGVIDEQGNILTSESADISHNSRDKILDEILAWLEKIPAVLASPSARPVILMQKLDISPWVAPFGTSTSFI